MNTVLLYQNENLDGPATVLDERKHFDGITFFYVTSVKFPH